jgi:hypothetical protein
MGITGMSMKKKRLAQKWIREHKNAELSQVLWHYPDNRLWDIPKPDWYYDCWIEFFELEKKLNITKNEHSYIPNKL